MLKQIGGAMLAQGRRSSGAKRLTGLTPSRTLLQLRRSPSTFTPFSTTTSPFSHTTTLSSSLRRERSAALCSASPLVGLSPLARGAQHFSRSMTSSTTAQQGKGSSARITAIEFKAKEGGLSPSMERFYHLSTIALATAVPLALPGLSPLTHLADVIFTIAIPFHAYAGLDAVIDDYLFTMRGPLKMIAATAAVLLGLAFALLNIKGPGITESLKQLWRKPRKVEAK